MQLHYAASDDNAEVAGLLLEHGAPVDVRQKYSHYTALHIAACKGNMAAAVVLLDNGAALDAKDAWGHTPVHIAAAESVRGRKHMDMLCLLLARGAAVTLALNGLGIPNRRRVYMDDAIVEGAREDVLEVSVPPNLSDDDDDDEDEEDDE